MLTPFMHPGCLILLKTIHTLHLKLVTSSDTYKKKKTLQCGEELWLPSAALRLFM